LGRIVGPNQESAMKRPFSERLEAYPELKEYMEKMLDIVENTEGTLEKADDAELQVVENMRKIGATALQQWAVQQGQAVESQWTKEHPTALKHGKKKSTGKQP
jgi:hypothetical protein